MIIWLASWPRSGNTFLRIILKRCFNIDTYSFATYDTYFIDHDRNVGDLVGHVPYAGDWQAFVEQARSSPNVHVIKTHGQPLTCRQRFM